LTDRSGAVWVGCCETLFVVKTQILAENISHAVTEVAIASYAIFAAIYVAYQIRKWRAGKPMNLPKLPVLEPMESCKLAWPWDCFIPCSITA